MKFKMFVLLSVALATVALVLTACTNGSDKTPPAGNQNVLYYTSPMHPSVKADKPGSCPICNMTLQPVYGSDATTNSAPNSGTNAAARPYPLTTCLVDDMKLGSMGDPYVFVYQGQEIKFCCANCKPQFLQNPDKYLKKIADASSSPKNNDHENEMDFIARCCRGHWGRGLVAGKTSALQAVGHHRRRAHAALLHLLHAPLGA